jgi:membrane protein involved in colicin uptake
MPRATADDTTLIAVVVVGTILAVIVVAVLLWSPGSCGLATHTLGEGVTVHGPSVPAVIRLI